MCLWVTKTKSSKSNKIKKKSNQIQFLTLVKNNFTELLSKNRKLTNTKIIISNLKFQKHIKIGWTSLKKYFQTLEIYLILVYLFELDFTTQNN